MNSDYDDVYLIPKDISYVNSRTEVDLASDLSGLYPIFSAPMPEISGVELVIEMGKNNCLGILHRFNTSNYRKAQIDEIRDCNVPYGVAIGLNDREEELKVADYAVENNATIICVDIANGYIQHLRDFGKELRHRYGKHMPLMAGNVITSSGARELELAGFDYIRVGIGSGALCATRVKTGIGRNQLSAINDCALGSFWANIVSDGGISTPGNAVKSFALGADFVMIGRALAFANEAENKDGHIYGAASATNHTMMNKELKSDEGVDDVIPENQKKPLKEILDDFLWGIRSACTYLNCNSYKDILDNCNIVPINERSWEE